MKPLKDTVVGDEMWDWERELVDKLEAEIEKLEDELAALKYKRSLWYRKLAVRRGRSS
jgi:hypothetical protein